jgi:DNA-binding NtrC family response regulator
MEFDLEKARELFEAGQFASIGRGLGSLSNHIRQVDARGRSLLAHALVYTGRLTLASQLADSVDDVNSPLPAQAESRIALGLLRKREGRIDDACAEFRQAARLAKQSRDLRLFAWAHAHLFRVLADGLLEPHLTALLAQVRRSVSSAGDPHLAAFLHDSVAAMEAQRGRTSEAERHLRVARSLLQLRRNAWLEQLVAINSSCIALIECDSRRFEKYVTEGRKLSAITGHTASDAAMDTNDAHFALIVGDFGRASTLLQKILRAPSNTSIELAALEGLARLHLALDQLDDCDRVLNRIESLRGERLPATYTVRGAATLRAKLMIRRARWREAADFARSELVEFAKVNDSASSVALTMSRAIALACLGDKAGSSRDIFDAAFLGGAHLREHQAEYFETCGTILSQTPYPNSAAALKERSLRIWREHGNKYGPVDAEASEQAIATATRELTSSEGQSDKGHSTEQELSGILLDCAASAFDLAYNAKLLGQELQFAIRQIGLPADLLETHPSSKSLTQDNIRTLVLGEHRNRELTLVCEIPDEPYKAMLLGNILRLGRAALALERAREEERNRAALWPADPIESQGGAIFQAEQMQTILNDARRIAPTDVPVLITGETGTGKEVLARTIHALSRRAQATFLPFNCTSAPKDMLDSQLFGHRRGAFTGAIENFQGVVRAAAGGTLFLDEIGDTSLEVQPKLLRFIESNEIHPIGEPQPTPVDVRLIVATNADLDTLVSEGRFRADLFYRLNIVPLHLPPLRERRVEIPTLANHYLQKYALEYGKGDLRLAEDTMEYLVLYRWPGNTRELANEMRRLAVLAESGAIMMPEHLSPEIAKSRRTIPASERILDPTEVVVRLDQPVPAAVRYLEERMVHYAMKKCGGRVEEAATMLGLSRKGLYLKRQRFAIAPSLAPAPATRAQL